PTGHVWQLGVLKPILGRFYSAAYDVAMPWPTLDLETAEGGLEVKGLGGGLQTNSLRLRDANGGSWVIRAIVKDSARVMTWPVNRAAPLARLMEHGYTGMHPEAPLALPRLSEAIGVLHAEPRMFYLPDQIGRASCR